MAFCDEADHVLAAVGEPGDDPVGVDVEVADDRVLAGRGSPAPCAAPAAPGRRGGSPALRFSGLPASAVPNSLKISARRSLNGSRRVLLTRSFWTVVNVWSPYSSLRPGPGRRRAGPRPRCRAGSRGSTRRSATAAPRSRSAYSRKLESGPVISIVTTARLALVDVEVRSTVPAGDAGDPDLGAGDEAEGVVELDPVGVAVVGAGAGDDERSSPASSRRRRLSARSASWSGRHLARVAVEGAVVGERGRAVAGVALVGARAALQLVDGEAVGARAASERDRGGPRRFGQAGGRGRR